MKLPRDEDCQTLIKRLEKYGYSVTRQTGSHVRLETAVNGKHQITIPNHNPIKIGTLNSILIDIAAHMQLSKVELIKNLW